VSEKVLNPAMVFVETYVEEEWMARKVKGVLVGWGEELWRF